MPLCKTIGKLILTAVSFVARLYQVRYPCCSEMISQVSLEKKKSAPVGGTYFAHGHFFNFCSRTQSLSIIFNTCSAISISGGPPSPMSQGTQRGSPLKS